jgi:Flp pilus assembly protein TadG
VEGLLTVWGRAIQGYRGRTGRANGLSRGDNRGQATVELALILPVILVVLFGIAEFGRAFSDYLTLQHAVREGARSGVTGATDLEIAARVQACAPNLDPSRLSVTIAPAESMRLRGDYLTVSVAYRFAFEVPLFQRLAGAAFDLKAALTMRVE